MTETRNRATPEGRELGVEMARLCDNAEPAARLKAPTLLPRCSSCAFRAGPHLANGSPQTQMDAMKCVMEGRQFDCHEPGRADDMCSGWLMMVLAEERSDFRETPWPWMQRAEHNAPDTAATGCADEAGGGET